MAIGLNDSIRTKVAKPVEDKRMNNGIPYTSTIEANLLLDKITERYVSLEVAIGTPVNWKIYWYKNGVEDVDLVEKQENTGVSTFSELTGDPYDNTLLSNALNNKADIDG